MYLTDDRKERNSNVVVVIFIMIIIVVIAPIINVVIWALERKEQAMKRLKAKTSCTPILKNDRKPCGYTQCH